MEKKTEELFISYLEKTISKQEEDILIGQINSDQRLLEELSDIKKIWNTSQFAGSFSDKYMEEEWHALMRRAMQEKHTQQKGAGSILFWLPRMAAVFLLGIIVATAVTYPIFNSKKKVTAYQEVSTPAGAKSVVSLPDGSKIFLNAGSSIKYPNRFGEKEREVYLTGEAFFEVKSDRSKEFLVRTSEIVVRAYGTMFNVKSYPEEETIETTLVEGSIGVTRNSFSEKKRDEVMLEPNQRVVYFRKEKAYEAEAEAKAEIKEKKLTYLISKGIDPVQFVSWKEGTLFIDSETLGELAIKLERKYDVNIHFENENLKRLKFTGSLENETVEQVIEAIGIAANIDYMIDEREIWLTGRKE